MFALGSPTFTETSLPSQHGKVFIVTGASSGFGLELAKLLYGQDGTVYLATRSASKAEAAMSTIRALFPTSRGALFFLPLDLADLSAIPRAAATFAARETRLDVLWNNAGVMLPDPTDARTKQGFETQLGVNALGPLLFTLALRPILAATARGAEPGAVRVAWVSSRAVGSAPRPAINFEDINYEAADEDAWTQYSRSKVGVIVLAAEFARRAAAEGILSVSIDPGVATTDLQRTMSPGRQCLVKMLGYDAKMGAYTQLFAGLSPVVAKEYRDGLWVTPVGKLKPARTDFFEEELRRKYWDWAERQVQQYL